ncbi:flagellar basal body L-ring protein FlgH [Aureimonas mangrovi]|uniref:flagellar basal body L-ring protein FlgH n=1 Tax=Aureimonas mangrovi TaxID=2758041 RepID=UPI001FE83A7B|nr:flagellar basal body L-ring protein FlgH [Aureimonas mangrovi]
MTALRAGAGLLAMLSLSGCMTTRDDFRAEPAMSPVGTGIYHNTPIVQPAAFPADVPRTTNSLWTDRNADFFRDTRALKIGDIVTVSIEISDQAQLNNNTRRERDSGVDVGLDLGGAISGTSLGTVGGTIGLSNGTDSEGRGSIRRSERINLSIAAVVTQVLPNGNLFIAGQQEVRVNYELRVLNIAGFIRPGDILPNNTIPYDKIAEARISYGGRGRLSEVQQPGWGQQALDNVLPY